MPGGLKDERLQRRDYASSMDVRFDKMQAPRFGKKLSFVLSPSSRIRLIVPPEQEIRPCF